MSEVAGPDEHSGRGQVSGAAADGPRDLARRRAGRGAGAYHDFGRRHRRGERGQDGRRLSAPTLPFSTSTWIGCAISTISCRRTSTCLFSDRHTSANSLQRADLVIGAVLIPGAKAPRLVEREDLKLMKPGSVIIDVAIDQGGCVATSQPTTHSDPTYMVDEVLHYCVTNMPGAVGRTSTYALCNVTLPWALEIANCGIQAAAPDLRPVARAINLCDRRNHQ